jgi:oxygen-independent coproporphyrinogen-3 oxidase
MKDIEKVTRIQEIYSYINSKKKRRQTNKVLHCHPSPLFWNEHNIPLQEIMDRRKKSLKKIPKRLNLYVSIPYCLRTNPEACGYCLFPHEDYQGMKALNMYLEYLRKEGHLFRDFFVEDQLVAIYFGGGTPNICKADTYSKLMDIIREVFPDIPEHIEITLEGIPQLFTLEKLLRMKEAGINRISIGVQQLNDKLIKFSGRKQNSQQVFQVLEWCNDLGLRTSVDLIYGWPHQTVESMLKDLDAIVRTGIMHITHYELNLGGRTDFVRNKKNVLPTIDQNLEMFHVSKQFLESEGYYQVSTYDWEKTAVKRSGDFAFEDNMRHFFSYSKEQGITGMDMWGWGFAGVSYFIGTPDTPGCVYMNSTKVNDYFVYLNKELYPIERGYMYQIEDVRLGWLFQSLQSIKVDPNAYKVIFGIDLLAEYESIWYVLSELKWADVTSEKISLIGDGIYFTPLIQTLLASKRIEELQRL